MYGPVDSPDDRATRPAGPARRHHERHRLPAAAALGLSVTGLVAAFGLGTALLPASLTGPGTPAELPAAAVAALAPGAGGGAPGGKAVTPAANPSPTVPPSAIPSPTRTAATPAARITPAPPIKKKPTIAPGLAGQETEVIRLVNVERGKAGCGGVTLNVKLQTAIRLHVAELGRHGNLYISHVSDDGRTFVDRAKAQGYDDPGGENVARGQRNAAEVMNSWMNSAGHRANILNCGFKAIGVGAAMGVDGTIVWGQLFGRS